MSKPYRILHIITGLQVGGAEMALYRLLSSQDKSLFQSEVVSLTDDQPVGGMIRELGIPVTSLGFRPGSFDPRLIFRIRKEVLRYQPDIVQTWMYHADLLGGVAAKLAGPFSVVWNIRHTITDSGSLKKTTYLVARINAIFSHFIPTEIVCNAGSGKQTHISLGFAANKMLVIENGFDLSRFAPDQCSKPDVCQELGLPENIYLVGMAARYNPQKDHANFIRAASLLAQERQNVRFLLWGNNVDNANKALTELIASMNLQNSVLMLGQRMDTPRLFAALDIGTLSSAYGEAFPQVVGEAMACAVPCVVTDVGDAAFIVGDTGRVVPPQEPQSLANAWNELLSLPKSDSAVLGMAARDRVENLFNQEKTTQKYSKFYQDIIASREQP
jgi:glycosyltransferase involved in cell wall biosynthesis